MSSGVIVEERREVPVVEEVDVVVVGGGTAGMPAAVAAARNGARTAIVERRGYVGGAAVGGLVVTVPERAGVWGIEKELYDELAKIDGVTHDSWSNKPDNKWYVVSAPLCKCLGDVFLQRENVVLFYHSWCAGVAMDGSRIDAVIMESKSGRFAIRARMFVDATGDADLAAFAGAPTVKGDADGKTAPVTMMYMMSNVDVEKSRSAPGARENCPEKVSYFVPTRVNPGEINCWGGSIHGDGLDVRDLTRMEVELRQVVLSESANMRRHLPGLENAYVSCISEQMGVRETRRISAEYDITTQDADEERVFEDTVGKAYRFTLPYRALIPRKVDNLLVSGRCIGADDKVKRPIRIVPVCFTSGQAAGTAAALAARADARSRSVDVPKLQGLLAEGGINLGR